MELFRRYIVEKMQYYNETQDGGSISYCLVLNGWKQGIYYNIDGKYEYIYLDNKRNGSSYLINDGRIHRVRNYLNGVLYGSQYRWFIDGKIYYIQRYLNGELLSEEYIF